MTFDDCFVQNDPGAHYNYHQEYQAILICGSPVRELIPDSLLNSNSHWNMSWHSNEWVWSNSSSSRQFTKAFSWHTQHIHSLFPIHVHAEQRASDMVEILWNENRPLKQRQKSSFNSNTNLLSVKKDSGVALEIGTQRGQGKYLWQEQRDRRKDTYLPSQHKNTPSGETGRASEQNSLRAAWCLFTSVLI